MSKLNQDNRRERAVYVKNDRKTLTPELPVDITVFMRDEIDRFPHLRAHRDQIPCGHHDEEARPHYHHQGRPEGAALLRQDGRREGPVRELIEGTAQGPVARDR